jgi:hypothetical protein
MIPKNEQRDEKEGVLEYMPGSLKCIGRNVGRIVHPHGFYNAGPERKNDDDWTLNELYNKENGEY